MSDEELLLLHESITSLFRYDKEQGKLFFKDGQDAGRDASIDSRLWYSRRMIVRVCPDDPPQKRSKRWRIAVDTIVWWIETGEWREEGLIHLNGLYYDCRIVNLSGGVRPVETKVEPKEFFATLDRVFTYDQESGKLLWNTGINKGIEAGFVSPKGGEFKRIVRIAFEYDPFAPPRDIRVDSIVWWLVYRQWFPEGLVHKNRGYLNCRIENLAKPNTRMKY